jgi:hypothetical protein
MAYVAVSRGAYDAKLFTNDREGLTTALGHDVSHLSAHAPEIKPEQAIAPVQELAHEIDPPEHSLGMGMGL